MSDSILLIVNSQHGRRWQLYQDCDLWAYCDELMTDDEYRDFFGEDRHDG